jgi:predicted ArsR family transcriptional regulator
MASDRRVASLFGPGLGETQRALLVALKRRGVATLAELSRGARVAGGTVREHLHALASRGLVERRGARRRSRGRGRPEVLFGLSPAADALFPRQEGELLKGLVRFLDARGRGSDVEEFLRERIAGERDAALARVRDLTGPPRLAEAARILTESGFMAEVVRGPDGESTLRLCHCPIRDLVAVTRAPCRLEIAFAQELAGRTLARTAYIPDGDTACSYRPEERD